MINHVKSLVVV